MSTSSSKITIPCCWRFDIVGKLPHYTSAASFFPLAIFLLLTHNDQVQHRVHLSATKMEETTVDERDSDRDVRDDNATHGRVELVAAQETLDIIDNGIHLFYSLISLFILCYLLNFISDWALLFWGCNSDEGTTIRGITRKHSTWTNVSIILYC